METKLKQLITEKGLKQNFIAEKVGVTTATLSKIVRGDSIPTLPVALKIARVLGETVEGLWGDIIE